MHHVSKHKKKKIQLHIVDGKITLITFSDAVMFTFVLLFQHNPGKWTNILSKQ